MEYPADLIDVFRPDPDEYARYEACVEDLLSHPSVRSMKRFTQHGSVSCLEHCIYVSFLSYRISRKFGLDSRSAARGGLLHDMFLYNWHVKEPGRKNHAFGHAGAALANASSCFKLNDIEKDIILKHMWPLNICPPKYRESFIVSVADKCCAVVEIKKNFRLGRIPKKIMQRLINFVNV